MICPQCGADNLEGQGRFCSDCGLPLMDPAPMTCPHCGAAYSPEQGRFCDACGLSCVDEVRLPAERGVETELPRCRACGTHTDAAVCPGCGSRMPTPEE